MSKIALSVFAWGLVLVGHAAAGEPGDKAVDHGKTVDQWAQQLRNREKNRKEAAFALRMLRSRAEPAIADLIEALDDGDTELRREATLALVWIGNKASDPLTAALKDKRPAVRQQAALALAWLGPDHAEPAIPVLIEAARGQAPWSEPSMAIRSLGPLATNALIEALENDRLRLTAARLLAPLDPKRATASLIGSLDDKDNSNREQAVQALASIGSAAVPSLLKALQDENPNTRHAAASALEKMGYPANRDALPALVDALKADNKLQLRLALVKALGSIGPLAEPHVAPFAKDKDDLVASAAQKFVTEKPNVPALIQTLRNGKPEEQRSALLTLAALGAFGAGEAAPAAAAVVEHALTSDVRSAHAQVLEKIGAPALAKLLPIVRGDKPDTDPRARVWAVKLAAEIQRAAIKDLPTADDFKENREAALKKVKALRGEFKVITGALLGAVASQDVFVRRSAIDILDKMGSLVDPQLAPALANVLQDEDPTVGQRAARILGRMGPDAKVAVPQLIKALERPEPFVTGAAVNALGLIGPDAEAAINDLFRTMQGPGGLSGDHINALILIGEPAWPKFVGALTDVNEQIRAVAFEALARDSMKPARQKYVGTFVLLLDDRDKDVRGRACILIARTAPDGAEAVPAPVPALVKTLGDNDLKLRRAAMLPWAASAPRPSSP